MREGYEKCDHDRLYYFAGFPGAGAGGMYNV